MSDIGLDDLDISSDELNRFTKAFRNEEFKKLFAEYCQELNDPQNKRRYEEELTQLERERGIDITFINPESGYVIKTSVDGEKKAFINVCKSDKVERPSSTAGHDAEGNKGLDWSIPYTQSPPRRDADKKGEICAVYDVVFHPDALHLAERNPRFRQLVTETACHAVQSSYSVKIDMNNLRYPKIAFKGAARPTIIRKPSANPPNRVEPSPIDQIYPPLKTAAPKTTVEPITKSSKYTIPKFQIVHRRNVEFHEMINDKDATMNLTIPKELVVTVDLPLLSSTNDVTLDVTRRKVYLVSEVPAKYKLHIDLPFDVVEIDGTAKFDKTTRKLTIVLPVMKRNIVFAGDGLGARDDSGVESDQCGSSKEENSIGSDDEHKVSGFSEENIDSGNSQPLLDNVIAKTTNTFLEPTLSYEMPAFTCNTLDTTVAFTLAVKNVDPNSMLLKRSDRMVQIKFTSIGAGYFPINYAFCVRFPTDQTSHISDCQPDAWDNNVILQIEMNGEAFERCFVGLDEVSAAEELILNANASKNNNSRPAHREEDIEIDVSAVSEKEIQIDILNSSSTKSKHQATEEDEECDEKLTHQKQKRNKRKNKKSRSFSESHCDELKAKIKEANEEAAKIADEAIKKSATAATANGFGKSRSVSESSNDDQNQIVPNLKGILKRRSSYIRSISESSVDDHFYSCSIDAIGVGSIPEESGADEMSESCKKTVRFDNNIRRQLYRIRSTIVGQRKPKTNKKKKKKHSEERRYSEGEASDYEPTSATKSSQESSSNDESHQVQKPTAAAIKLSTNDHDSGIDLNENPNGKSKSKTIGGNKKSKQSIRKSNNHPATVDTDDDDVVFKSGADHKDMIFDFEM